jgi:hypothetical protein
MIAMNANEGPKAIDETHTGKHPASVARAKRNAAPIGGLVLLAAGVGALLHSTSRAHVLGSLPFSIAALGFYAWDLLFLPALGGVFLAWGLAVRKMGLLVLGGVLGGLGLGVLAIQGPFGLAGPDAQGGVILIAMALGWATVAIFAIGVVKRRAWWPFIPATVLGALGVALLSGGRAGVATLGAVTVPSGLIAIGVMLVVRRRG